MNKNVSKRIFLILTALLLTAALGVVMFGCVEDKSLDEINSEQGNISSNQSSDGGSAGATYNDYTVTTNVGTPSTVYSSYTEMVDAVVDSVVMVYVKNSSSSEWISNGSGVFYGEGTDDSGNKVSLIVTCCHVVDGSTAVAVGINTADTDSSNDKTVTAEIVGMDDVSDIAVLKIDGGGYNYATLRNTDEAPIVLGEEATPIGNALGAGISVTKGIISGISREVSMDGIVMTLLQTDASVNGGNSGGALFDAQGYLIGIVNAKSGGTNVEGIGYAIPIYDVIEKADSIISTAGNPEFGGLGYVEGEIRLGATFAQLNAAQTQSNFASIPSVPGTGEYYYYVNSSSADINRYGSISKSGATDTMAHSIIKSVTVNGVERKFSDSFLIDDLIDSVNIGDSVTFNLIIPEIHSAGFWQPSYYTYTETTCEITMYQYVYGLL